MIALTFARRWGVYNAGETAGFDAENAEALITAGIASLAADPEPAPEPQPEPAPEPATAPAKRRQAAGA